MGVRLNTWEQVGGFFLLGFLFLSGLALPLPAAENEIFPGTEMERLVVSHRAIEDVYWAHRIWPASNGTPKPSLDQVLPPEALRFKVQDVLAKQRALHALWGFQFTPAMLQAEIDRMAKTSRRPDVLRELFAALDNDPLLVAECLARPSLVEKAIRQHFESDARFSRNPLTSEPVHFDLWWEKARENYLSGPDPGPRAEMGIYELPLLKNGPCTDGTWDGPTQVEPEARKSHTAVWTGSEMIVWGGSGGNLNEAPYLNSGGRYNPATDSWIPTSEISSPSPRAHHTAVWTGTEMIVWGGNSQGDGARYNPVTDGWAPLSLIDAPSGRSEHTAVWTGTTMIVWGGNTNTGGQYDPYGDKWTPTSLADAPSARYGHTAVWTGTEMIVW